MRRKATAFSSVIAFSFLPLATRSHAQPLLAEAATDSATEEVNFKDLLELDLEELLATPVVEIASRRSQSQAEAPTTITVLTSDDIGSSAVTNVAEVLRKVPGAFVLQTTANTYQIGLRGISLMENNRVLVLLDGRKVNERMAGIQAWSTLGMPADAIDRIEVMRGGSTLFGADALSGVVSIKTRRPLDAPGFRASLNTSLGYVQENDGEPWMSNSGRGSLSYNWANALKTLGLGLCFGYSRIPDWPSGFDLVYIKGPHDFSVRALLDYRPNPDWTLFASLEHSMTSSMSFADASMFLITNSTSKQAFTLNLVKQRLFTDALTFRAVLDGSLSDSTNRPGSADSSLNWMPESSIESLNFDIHTLLLTDWSIWNGRDILTLGLEGQYIVFERFYTNPTYLYSSLILNNELRLLSDSSLVLSMGSRFEQVLMQESDIGEVLHRTVSPRVALVYQPSKGHALRLAATTAFRMPTPYEAYANLVLRHAIVNGKEQEIPEDMPGMRVILPNPFLKPEQSYNLELGYLGRFSDALRVESVVFGQRLLDPIGDSHEMSLVTYKENRPSVWMVGLELSCTFVIASALSVKANYTTITSWSDAERTTDRSWPAHIYYLGLDWRLPWRSRFNLDAYMVFDYKPELTSRLTATGNFQATSFYARQAADQAFVDLRLGHLVFDNVEVFVAVKNLLGFIREPDGLRMVPYEFVQPIGGMAMIGVQLKGGV